MSGGRKVIFIGGADELRLSEHGQVYRPGDEVTLPDRQRLRLQAAGLRFGEVPDEPIAEAAPDPPPLESADASRAAIAAKDAPTLTAAATFSPPSSTPPAPSSESAKRGKGGK